ncbi:hypothetical protein M406DRAFT_71399 [Cryphonectria parasitica EP155]|uniref:Uncharacterized protein n=1 Tax=Cryphonectria parasitica (strain ATCC 38755 / EP155) TaxID=660469 RepID=A0A9P5CS96_CRYP1|nr:uncharacterized protein M406DRAFT_71399 [Cryphonectria parasitica EP155]KAF3768347.1 hypothetical protein M406DRAFT_71399 [Cryphonectria parasitica EP155]
MFSCPEGEKTDSKRVASNELGTGNEGTSLEDCKDLVCFSSQYSQDQKKYMDLSPDLSSPASDSAAGAQALLALSTIQETSRQPEPGKLSAKAQARLDAKAAAEEAAVQRRAAERAAIAEEKRAERRTAERAADRAAAKAAKAAITKAQTPASPIVIEGEDESDDAEQAEDPEAIEIATPAEVRIDWHYPPHRRAQFRGIAPPGVLTKRFAGVPCFLDIVIKDALTAWLDEQTIRVARVVEGRTVRAKYSFARIVVGRGNTIHRGEKIHCDEVMNDDFRSAAQQISDVLLDRKNPHWLIITYTFNLEVSGSRYVPHALSRGLPPAAAGQLAADTQVAIEAEASEFNDLFTPASTTARALQTPGTARSRSKASSLYEQINAEIASQRDLHRQLNIHWQCRDPIRYTNNRNSTKFAVHCWVEPDGRHLKLDQQDLMQWAEKIANKAEKADVDHIPLSIYRQILGRAIFRAQATSSTGDSLASSSTAEAAPASGIWEDLLGRRGKARAGKSNSSIGGNIININGGGDPAMLAQLLQGQLNRPESTMPSFLPPSAPPMMPPSVYTSYQMPGAGPSSRYTPSQAPTTPPGRLIVIFSSSPVVPEGLDIDGFMDEFFRVLRRRKARDLVEAEAVRRMEERLARENIALSKLGSVPYGWYDTHGIETRTVNLMRQFLKEFLIEKGGNSVNLADQQPRTPSVSRQPDQQPVPPSQATTASAASPGWHRMPGWREDSLLRDSQVPLPS